MYCTNASVNQTENTFRINLNLSRIHKLQASTLKNV